MLKVSLSLEGNGYLHFSDPSLLHRPDGSFRDEDGGMEVRRAR